MRHSIHTWLAPYLFAAIIAGLLHAAWEYLHLPLYTNYEAMGTGSEVLVNATFGDVVYTLGIIVCVMWLLPGENRTSRVSQYILAAVLGLFVAVFVEYKAMYLHKWAYSAFMPMIPFLGIGLSPLLQMVILTPCTLFLSRAAMRVWRNK